MHVLPITTNNFHLSEQKTNPIVLRQFIFQKHQPNKLKIYNDNYKNSNATIFKQRTGRTNLRDIRYITTDLNK